MLTWVDWLDPLGIVPLAVALAAYLGHLASQASKDHNGS